MTTYPDAIQALFASFPQNVVRLAKAIEIAEGSNPTWNNPGDLTGEDAGSFVTLGTANSEGVLKFSRLIDGWLALLHKCDKMLAGRSHVYALGMTLEQVGQLYAHGASEWAKNVAFELGTLPTTTLKEISAC